MTDYIRVLHHFSGKESKEREIVPGVYAGDDPALFGLARYLVENGHAVEAEVAPEVLEVVADSEAQASDDEGVVSAPSADEGRLHLESIIEELSRDSAPPAAPPAPKAKGKR